eukprot:6198653-Amphidinium_carterae.2
MSNASFLLLEIRCNCAEMRSTLEPSCCFTFLTADFAFLMGQTQLWSGTFDLLRPSWCRRGNSARVPV